MLPSSSGYRVVRRRVTPSSSRRRVSRVPSTTTEHPSSVSSTRLPRRGVSPWVGRKRASRASGSTTSYAGCMSPGVVPVTAATPSTTAATVLSHRRTCVDRPVSRSSVLPMSETNSASVRKRHSIHAPLVAPSILSHDYGMIVDYLIMCRPVFEIKLRETAARAERHPIDPGLDGRLRCARFDLKAKHQCRDADEDDHPEHVDDVGDDGDRRIVGVDPQAIGDVGRPEAENDRDDGHRHAADQRDNE